MRIAFIDFIDWDYHVATPLERPLGGSQSAMCYLAAALAKAGHEVTTLTNTSRERVAEGVACRALKTATSDVLASFDVAVLLNNAVMGPEVRTRLRPQAKLILWTQHAHDQPAMQPLAKPRVRDTFDCIALVSQWQQARFSEHLEVDGDRTRVLRNAVAPCFADLNRAPDVEALWAQKSPVPTLVYTSTPFRGLDVLVDVFPQIRSRVSDARLRVFSSMQVYQSDVAADVAKYGSLYRACCETEGVEYVGSLAQPQLAEELKSAWLLAYPNHFAETSCICVLEALASGCQVVTSELGALPETSAGFARLVPLSNNAADYASRFLEETIASIDRWRDDPAGQYQQLQDQVSHVHNSCTWQTRAAEWSALFTETAN